jgi:hypothetical protein
MTRRTRRLLLFGLSAALGAILLAVWLVWPRTVSAIILSNAAKIRPGMTLVEAEAILGGPARDECTGPTKFIYSEAETRKTFTRGTLPGLDDRHAWLASLVWRSDHARVQIGLTQDHRVAWLGAYPVRRYDEGPLDRLCRWLGL